LLRLASTALGLGLLVVMCIVGLLAANRDPGSRYYPEQATLYAKRGQIEEAWGHYADAAADYRAALSLCERNYDHNCAQLRVTVPLIR
jgi:tetratricopeptide (TPR) repeat protein